ncbi:ATP-binding protein [Helicobacter sp. 23-1044]
MRLKHLDALKGRKNLLAFSGGVDSTALFFALMRQNIDFDLAMVDYGVRKSAKDELKYGKKLAKQYHKKIYIFKSPKIKRNFEGEARRVRYAFFERVILSGGYENLILAHQLNDRFEWLLMQLTKGCGLNSLLGFSSNVESSFCFCHSERSEESHNRDFSQTKFAQNDKNLYDSHLDSRLDSHLDSPLDSRQNYRIIRPMSEISRFEIVAFLKKHKIKFFVDSSNENAKFKRNYFRKNFGNKLVKKFGRGIVKSFRYLSADFVALYGKSQVLQIKHIFLIPRADFLPLQLLAQIDSVAKKLGYVISKNQRDEIAKSNFSCVVAGKIIIDSNQNFIFMCANDLTNAHKCDKKFREKMRIAKIPPKIRPFVDETTLDSLKNAMDSAKNLDFTKDNLCKFR